MKIKQIIFDFDGVILNSHIVKTNAFYYVFRKFGEPIAKAAKKHHLKNTGISRIRKFKFILKYNCKTKIFHISHKSEERLVKHVCDYKNNTLYLNYRSIH